MRRFITLAASLVIIAATLGMAGATGAAEQSAGARDIVFVVDSTGLSEADWSVQKRAYLALLDDPTQFPLDGTTSVAFIQYASTRTGGQASRVTVPFIRLDGISARGRLTSSIREAALLTPEKAGVDGLSAAAQELSARGTKGAPASICATANAPWDPTTLAQGTGATKSAGATRLSMLTLTSTSLSAALADQSFAAAVFGDGSVLSARNVPQFGNLISSSCLLPSLRLEAIEVNQAIQDWNNSQPLVQYKDTIVRVFLETVALSSGTASGLLHGERDGVPLSNSPLSPINAGGTISIDSDVDNETDRKDQDSSLNFRLPTSWLSGDVTLTFEAPSTMTCSSAPTGAQDCDVDVRFVEAVEPEVDYVSVPYEAAGVYREPTDAALVENMYRTEDIFPIRYVDFDFDWMPGTVDDTIPDLEVVNAYLQLYAMYEDCLPGLCSRYYYGILDGSGGGLANGVPGTMASGFLSGTGATGAYGYARNRGPHEIAHMIGAHHIVNEAENGTTTDSWGSMKNGWCQEEASMSAPEFGNWFWSSSQARDFPILGPTGSDDVEIWGFSPRFLGVDENLTVIDPYQVFPLMSYCGALDSSSHYRWPSDQTYDALADALHDPDFDGPAAIRAPKPTDVVVVRGIVDPTGVDDVRFLPVAPVSLSRPPAVTPGDWTLQIVDRNGKVVSTRSFAMTETHGDAAAPDSGEPEAGMQFAVPFPAGIASRIASIRLLRGQQLVASTTASARAPQVSIQSPKAGEQLAGDTVTVRWNASDRDSTEVTATVLYRSGPQARWTPVAIDAAGTSVRIPRKALAGSRSGEFMVIASDGVRLARARSGPVTIGNNAPILSLQQSAGSITAAQNITLEAAAWDAEDGVLDQQIVWTSSIDGRLGTGRVIDLDAASLSEGVHRVTVRAIDSAKSSASSTFTLTIGRVAQEFAGKQD